MEANHVYPSDLTDGQWAVLAPLLPPPKSGGRPRRLNLRAVLNAIFYVDRTGCQWRYLPTEYPNWKTVYWYFTRFQDDGTWEAITDALRRQVRRQLGRDPEPSAAILDSQSVKTTQKGGERLRREQEGKRPQAPPARRCRGPGRPGGGAARRDSGP